MSNLDTVKELLLQDCFCHSGELNYMIECMPASIQRPSLKHDTRCYHNQEKQIKQALLQFQRFMETNSLFKVGDRVELNHTPRINAQDSWGWLSFRHFIIQGAKATVTSVSYHHNEFNYLIEFDNDNSWIDEKDEIHLNSRADRRHNFTFNESALTKADVTPCYFLKKLWNDFYRIGD